MEVISYLNMFVNGVTFINIQEFTVSHQINEHGTAEISGEVETLVGEDFIKRVDETTTIEIGTTAKGQPSVLFCGVVADASLKQKQEYTILRIKLKSVSSILDLKKNNKSFQNTVKTYEEILNQVYRGSARLTMAVSDKPIGNLIMQYQETDWEFTKRMASVFSAPVITNITTKIPQLTIGMPNSEKIHHLASVEYSYGGADTGIGTNQYLFVGDSIKLNGKVEKVKKISSTMVNGVVTTSAQAARTQEIIQAPIPNVQASGKIFTGIVQAVEGDKVQAHLIDIDGSYDEGGSHWFPYSTAYSSSDGSGFYCMPEVGDQVRVFFPSDNEGAAFAASSVCVSPLENPKHKRWATPGGKSILMTEDGIRISCKDDETFIYLSDDDGIYIKSNKDINLCAAENMLLMAKKDIKLQASDHILINSGSSYIEVRKDTIELGAEHVVIN